MITTTSDPTPYEQGYEDWEAFGDAANALQKGEEGYEAYERGKAAARQRFRNSVVPS